MREIKFKAWSRTNNEWFMEGDAFDLNFSGKYGEFFFDNDAPYGMAEHNLTWVQFTGLRDKNGREVYEGDLLEEAAGYLFEVVWDSEYAKFRLQWRTKAIQYPEWNRGKKMAVVGNIFEHPHLLKEDQP